MPRDDAELLTMASQGDQSAFATLYNEYEADLYRFVFYLADGPETAEELFQDTWLRAARHLGKKRITNFKKWLFTVAANLYRDELRKRKVRRLFLGRDAMDENLADPGAGGGPLVPPAAGDFAIRDALDKAMKKLTGKQRAVFVLSHVEGFKMREVCEILGKPEGTVKSTLHRAIEILRRELKEFR